jgi:hypothetical protein
MQRYRPEIINGPRYAAMVPSSTGRWMSRDDPMWDRVWVEVDDPLRDFGQLRYWRRVPASVLLALEDFLAWGGKK